MQVSMSPFICLSSFLENSISKAGYSNYYNYYMCLHIFLYMYVCISGHYVPQLAKLMIEMNTKNKIFNLKGIAVSNIIVKVHLSIINAFFFSLVSLSLVLNCSWVIQF